MQAKLCENGRDVERNSGIKYWEHGTRNPNNHRALEPQRSRQHLLRYVKDATLGLALAPVQAKL